MNIEIKTSVDVSDKKYAQALLNFISAVSGLTPETNILESKLVNDTVKTVVENTEIKVSSAGNCEDNKTVNEARGITEENTPVGSNGLPMVFVRRPYTKEPKWYDADENGNLLIDLEKAAKKEAKETRVEPQEEEVFATDEKHIPEEKEDEEDPFEDEPEISGIDIATIRKAVSEKAQTHRNEIKNKLTEFGANNVATLEASKYQEFYEYVTNL